MKSSVTRMAAVAAILLAIAGDVYAQHQLAIETAELIAQSQQQVVAEVAASVASTLPTDPSYVTINAQAGLDRSQTECDAYAATTTVNVWTNAPAEVTNNAVQWLVRYIEIHNVTDSATPFASEYVSARLGPSADTPVLSLTNGARIMSGASRLFQVRRPIAQANPQTGIIPLWVHPSDNVTLCVTWFW